MGSIPARLVVLAAACATLVSAAPVQDPPKSEKEKKARLLMELTGAANVGKQTMDGMLDHFSKTPGVPENFVKKFKELARPQDLVEMVVPIYLKHLDEPTLDSVIAFYKSEAGVRLMKAQPLMVKESMEAGQKWGQDLATKVLQALQDEEKEK